MSDPQPELAAFIDAVRRRWLTCVRLRAVGLAALAAALPLAAAVLVDRVGHPQGGASVLLAATALLLSASLAGYLLWRMPRRPDDRRVARFIEERAALDPHAPRMDDVVVTAVSVVPPPAGGAAGFNGLLAAAALGQLSGRPPSAIVPGMMLRRAGLIGVAGLIVLSATARPAAPLLVDAAEAAWLAWSPESLQIDVLPGDARVPSGRPFRVRAVVRVGGRVVTRLEPSLVVSATGDRRTTPMPRQGDGFEFAFESIDRSFTYRVTASGQMSREYTVSALLPPKVRRIEAHYDYPAFSGLAPRDEEDGGDIYAPEGTRVRLRVHTDKPVASGALALSDGVKTTPLRKAGDSLLETELVLTKDDAYRLQLSDADGLRGGGDTEYFIRLMDDRPPDVRILRPNGDQQITPLEEVAIEARADDDYGISAFDLVYSVAGRPEKTTPFSRVSGTNVAKVGGQLLAAEELQVQPGDVITYYARARDVGRGKRSTETKSDMFFLEVRPFNEEFVSAESQAMAASGDPQLETLIAAQKEIINATWNIERRSGAGRSAADVKSVSQAQTELRARTERMGRDARGPAMFQQPQQIGTFGQRSRRPTGADAVAAAVKSMGLATQQLDGDKTKEALPHEMAALQALLQAQSEIRRRQVAQQANGASGNGFGRQGQDLSALFDKELQRQQRTNYETRSQIEERPDNREEPNSALDRVRDLARRQEDLSRRERELAQSPLASEEQKRQLEKLTREQQELREQAERMGREMESNGQSGGNRSSAQNSGQEAGRSGAQRAQSPGSSQGASGGAGAGGGGGEMREAAEQMRGSAGDLQRQDPAAAAARAQRAAEQLREMEQRLRNSTPAGSQRANGDLRLEGQQIVDAQRRIADQAARLGQDAGANATAGPARQRLAGEQASLADRVEAFERAARAVGQGKNGKEDAARAAEAATELKREQIAERMRSAAKEMGQGRGAGQPQAGAEQEIARALDRAVGRLGGGGTSADARSLSQQLDQSRAIRERLDRLGEQIRQAEQSAAAQSGGRQGSASPQPGGRGGAAAGGRGSATGGAGDTLAQLREQYGGELARAREALGKLTQGPVRDGQGGATPEEQVFSQSAPGNEAFKQDFTNWESLRKGVDLALERYESSVSQRLARTLAADRLSAGGSERGPAAYDRLIARYYESLARSKK